MKKTLHLYLLLIVWLLAACSQQFTEATSDSFHRCSNRSSNPQTFFLSYFQLIND